MKKKYLIGLGGIIVVIASLGLAMTQIRSVRSGSPCSTPTPPVRSGLPTSTPTPQYNSQFNPNVANVLPRPTPTSPKVTDLSPKVADNDKALIIIQHADGGLEEFLVGPDFDIEAFIKHLPRCDKLFGVNPPPSIMAPFYTPGP